MKKHFDFQIKHVSKKSKARVGVIITPHGQIQTPAFVTVGTKGTVKSLSPQDLDPIKTQFIFVNTYHTVLSPGSAIIKKSGGIHKYSQIQKPIITDSGGFQVFSLAGHRKLKVGREEEDTDLCRPTSLVLINDDGIKFKSHIDGKQFIFTPEYSIQAQIDIGADFIVSLDENIYYGATRKYTQKSLMRTQNWAKRSLNYFNKQRIQKQQMYGVIQGGMYEDLHKNSSKKIASLPFFGLAIGGVSVGMTKKEIYETVSWSVDIIHSDKRPRHLLGIGHLDDIIEMVKLGIDTFDCVVPTRHARMGKLYSSLDDPGSDFSLGRSGIVLDIMRSIYKNDLGPIDIQCKCYTCQNFTCSYLHHLFKQRELFAYRLGTIHNLTFIETYFEALRSMILKDEL